METIACNLCGSTEHKVIFKHKDTTFRVTEEIFNIVQCSSCGLVFVNPRPTEEEITKYYVSGFYQTQRTADEELKIRKSQIQAKQNKIKHLKPGKVLDIGCMKGEFLFELKQRGWEIEGIDISEVPDNLFDLNIHYGANFLELDLPESSFDLITMWAVMEHVHDPMAFFKKINRLLKPGGRLVFLVTNFDSPQGKLMQLDDYPRHLTIFSRDTINKYLEKTNFRLRKTSTETTIFRTVSTGFLIFMFRHIFCRQPINELAYEFRDNSEKFLSFNHPDNLFVKLFRHADSFLCQHVVEPVFDLFGKGHLMTAEAEKLEK